MSLCTDGWNRQSHKCTRNEFGVWELFIPNNPDGSSPIPHGTKVKVSEDSSKVDTENGNPKKI